MTIEIDNKAFNNMLPSELEIFIPPVSQKLPYLLFFKSGIISQFPRKNLFYIMHQVPSYTPSPPGTKGRKPLCRERTGGPISSRLRGPGGEGRSSKNHLPFLNILVSIKAFPGHFTQLSPLILNPNSLLFSVSQCFCGKSSSSPYST